MGTLFTEGELSEEVFIQYAVSKIKRMFLSRYSAHHSKKPGRIPTWDSGFAPNPFGSFLTLATCKPQIRKHPRKGDYIIGTGSSATVGNHKLVYAGEIADVFSLADYGKSPTYKSVHQ
jgi:hypothetical protein